MGYALKHTKGKVGSKLRSRGRRHLRVRRRVIGTAVRPRLVVTRSSRHVFVQIVDDSLGKTIASASTMEADLRGTEARQDRQGPQRRRPSSPSVPRLPGSTPSCSTAAATSTTAVWQPSPTALARPAWRCDRRPGHRTRRGSEYGCTAAEQRSRGLRPAGDNTTNTSNDRGRPPGRRRSRWPSGWPRPRTGRREVGIPRARREHQPRLEGRQGRPSFLLHRSRGGG